MKYLIAFLMIFSLTSYAAVLDNERSWGHHTINDMISQKKFDLVGYIPNTEKQNDPDIGYMLHIAPIQEHKSFLFNLALMKGAYKPNSDVVINLDGSEFVYNTDPSDKNGIPIVIRPGPSAMTMNFFSYFDLDTCSGNFRKLAVAENMTVTYTTTDSIEHKINVDMHNIVDVMVGVYKIPYNCSKAEPVTLVFENVDSIEPKSTGDIFDTSSESTVFVMLFFIVLAVVVGFAWSVYVSILAYRKGRSRVLWFVLSYLVSPMITHIIIKKLSIKEK